MNPHEDERDPLALRGYPIEQQPGRDLWPGIAARLKPRQRPRWPYLAAALAASLVLAVGLRLSELPQSGSPRSAPAPVELARAPLRGGNRALVKANLKIVTDAERQLQQALRSDPQSDSLQRLLQSTRAQRQSLRRLLAS